MSRELVSRGAPAPILTRLPSAPQDAEADRAHGGSTVMLNKIKSNSADDPRVTKAKLENHDSGLDELTQLPDKALLRPVSCTDGVDNLIKFPEKRATKVSPAEFEKPVVAPREPAAPTRSEQDEQPAEVRTGAMQDSRLLRMLGQFFVEDEDGESMLHLATLFENRNAIRYLLKLTTLFPLLQTCLNDQNKLKQTPAHLAASLNLFGILEDLVTAGAEMDLQDCYGNTPLHTACKKGHLECIDVLLTNVNNSELRRITKISNNEGYNAVTLAVIESHIKVIQRLHNIGCDINTEDKKSGLRPIHHALRCTDSLRVIRCLVDSGADVNLPAYNGCTALHIAAGNGNINQVAYLIALGADPYCISDEGELPIHCATNDLVIDLLRRAMNELRWH